MTLGQDAKEKLAALERTIVERAKGLQRQREFIEQVSSAVSMEPPNYSVLRRVFSLPAKDEVLRDFEDDAALLREIQEATEQAWARMNLVAVNDFVELAQQGGLPVEGQAPR